MDVQEILPKYKGKDAIAVLFIEDITGAEQCDCLAMIPMYNDLGCLGEGRLKLISSYVDDATHDAIAKVSVGISMEIAGSDEEEVLLWHPHAQPRFREIIESLVQAMPDKNGCIIRGRLVAFKGVDLGSNNERAVTYRKVMVLESV